jgi:hypothetical protein
MIKIHIDGLTVGMIGDLKQEAGEHNDKDMVLICVAAQRGSVDAQRRVLAAIEDAAAQRDEEHDRVLDVARQQRVSR